MANRPRLVFGVIGDIQTNNAPCMAGVTSVATTLRRFGATAVLVGDTREWRLVDLPDDAAFDLGAACRAAFAEKKATVELLRKDGVPFVLCNTKTLTEEDRQGFFSREAQTLRSAPVFFYAQLRHPKGTVFGDFIDGQDGGVSTQTLNGFANAVAISTGCCGPLTDERAIAQGRFTSVSSGAFRRSVLLAGRENSEEAHPIRNRHGLVVSVYDDRVVFARVALKGGERLGPDWTLSFADREALSVERRKRTLRVPEFAPGAKVSVNFVAGKTTKGEAADLVRVTFPTATPVRAYEYEVTVVCAEGGVDAVVAQKRVYSRGVVLPPEAEPAEATCDFDRGELYHDLPLRFEVRPLDSFGRKGRAISAERTVKSTPRNGKGTRA